MVQWSQPKNENSQSAKFTYLKDSQYSCLSIIYSKLEDLIHSTDISSHACNDWYDFDCKYIHGSDNFKYKIDTYKTIWEIAK